MKKFKIESLIYIYIILLPILDSFSNMYRVWFPNGTLSPAMFLRLIIPGILLIYIMIKDKESKRYLIIMGIVYAIYGFIHLFIFNRLLTEIAYGDFLKESTYIINYTFNIFMLYIIYYFNKNNKLSYLKESLYIMLIVYLIIIYFSIITKTSLSTYIEGLGYRSYFVSSNSLCTILLLLLSVLIKPLYDSKKWYNILILVALGTYLGFLVGTRTGLFGFILVIGMYVFLNVLIGFSKKIKFDKKNVLLLIVLLVVLLASLYKIGSNTFKRQAIKEDQGDDIIDVNTGEVSHVTGDTMMHVKDIKDNVMSDKYLSKERQKALLSMYNKCNEMELNLSDRRTQQLIYNFYKAKYEHNISYLTFGNGYVNDYGEMILEMEVPALLFNFGILGFLLYLGPILYYLVQKIKELKNNKRLLDVNNLLMIFGLLLALGLATFAGYVLFSTTCALIMISIICLIDTKKVTLKKVRK